MGGPISSLAFQYGMHFSPGVALALGSCLKKTLVTLGGGNYPRARGPANLRSSGVGAQARSRCARRMARMMRMANDKLRVGRSYNKRANFFGLRSSTVQGRDGKASAYDTVLATGV